MDNQIILIGDNHKEFAVTYSDLDYPKTLAFLVWEQHPELVKSGKIIYFDNKTNTDSKWRHSGRNVTRQTLVEFLDRYEHLRKIYLQVGKKISVYVKKDGNEGKATYTSVHTVESIRSSWNIDGYYELKVGGEVVDDDMLLKELETDGIIEFVATKIG